MKTDVRREAKSALLLFLWLLLGQMAMAALFAVAAMLVLALGAFGVIPLVGRAPLWLSMAVGALACLPWLAVGRLAPPAARPGPAVAAAVLAVWAVLTSLLRGIYLLFLPQELCGGMLGRVLELWGCGYLTAKGLGVTLACFLLPAAAGAGLYWGRKRAAASGDDG